MLDDLQSALVVGGAALVAGLASAAICYSFRRPKWVPGSVALPGAIPHPAPSVARKGSLAKPPHTSAQIRDALDLLVNKPRVHKAWVVVEHRSGKFVQFAGSVAEPLVLNLPWQPMTEVEFYRAVEYFKKLGVAGDEVGAFDEHGARIDAYFCFDVTFRSVDAAAETALAIFKEVYNLTEYDELSIATSWGAGAKPDAGPDPEGV
jgi:hypothetical protein